jgi:hypothetical protein
VGQRSVRCGLPVSSDRDVFNAHYVAISSDNATEGDVRNAPEVYTVRDMTSVTLSARSRCIRAATFSDGERGLYACT